MKPCPKHGDAGRDSRGRCRACHAAWLRGYRSDPAVRDAEKARERARMADPAVRDAYNAQCRERMADPAVRAARNARKRIYHAANLDKHCAAQARRRAAKLQRTPAWADFGKIAEVYELAAEGQRLVGGAAVDHILPLLGRTVSGLHVHQNLRLVLDRHNGSKGNRVTPALLAQVEAEITAHVRKVLG